MGRLQFDVVVETCPHCERPYEAVIVNVGENGTHRWRVETSYRDGCGGYTIVDFCPARVLYRGETEIPHRFVRRV